MTTYLLRIDLGGGWRIEGTTEAPDAAEAAEIARRVVSTLPVAETVKGLPIWVGLPLQPAGWCYESMCRAGGQGVCTDRNHRGWHYRGVSA